MNHHWVTSLAWLQTKQFNKLQVQNWRTTTKEQPQFCKQHNGKWTAQQRQIWSNLNGCFPGLTSDVNLLARRCVLLRISCMSIGFVLAWLVSHPRTGACKVQTSGHRLLQQTGIFAVHHKSLALPVGVAIKPYNDRFVVGSLPSIFNRCGVAIGFNMFQCFSKHSCCEQHGVSAKTSILKH